MNPYIVRLKALRLHYLTVRVKSGTASYTERREFGKIVKKVMDRHIPTCPEYQFYSRLLREVDRNLAA